jgi:hypothetical protein
MSKGYILLVRQLLRHPRFKPRGSFTQFEAWYWLIEAAAFSVCEVPVMNGHRREIITLQPGQLSHSIRFLASAWKWSPNRVQRFLRDLAVDGSVTTQTDTAQTLITLCNWGKYQRPFREANTQSTTPTDTPTDTKKKELKELERKNAHQGFDEWWADYPRKVSKAKAEKAFSKVVPTLIAFSALMERTKAFAAIWKDKPRAELTYCPHPSTWLNDARYNDADLQAKPAPTASDRRTFTDAKWQKILTYAQENGWSLGFGPRPGEPGCLVPSHLLIARVSRGAA